jgi:nucleotidyltransferase substrate binding protein (TIGR01987 family)
MDNQDIRWIQRFHNYERALSQFNEAIALFKERPLSNLERQGMIQAFEFTHELAWKTLQDYLRYQGIVDIVGSRDVFRKALEVGLIHEGEKWFESIQSRNLTSHVYDQDVVNDLIQVIVVEYDKLLNSLYHTLEKLSNH